MKHYATRPDRPHKRKAPNRDRTRSANAWRITASWDSRPDRPAVRTTSDKKARNRMVRTFTADGAYVIVEEQHGPAWRTWREFNGAEQLRNAARAEQEQAEAAARETRHRADYDRQVRVHQAVAVEQAAADRDRLAALMRRPPIARQSTGHATARHITGSQR
ncbi:hypothetical protein [Streptomyces sp. NBC_01237]|uniref:hypothetical protein n=1 Tax=Streptomyces sp. NBC_01237 TaxID=2903790 RepID=UPI002DDC2CD8|nr:hypothetical protein [Streptomyces sp. NBC_01237]WRZ73804.1 hypothetical protein OG251_20400 [Streptomyces sp. NBC_01237]